MPNKLKAVDWLCVSAYVRAQEAKLLTETEYGRMLDAHELSDAIRVLQDHGYAVAEPSLAAVESAVRQARAELFADFSAFSMDDRLLDLFRIRYDYHNVKVVLKAAAAGMDAEHLLLEGGRFEKQDFARRLREEEDDTLPEIMAAAVKDARRLLFAAGDPQKADFALDRACFAEMAALAADMESPFIDEYVRLMIDAENVKALLRVLRMYAGAEMLAEAAIPGGRVDVDHILAAVENGALTEPYMGTPLAIAVEEIAQAVHGGGVMFFEKACDNALMHYLQDAALVPFGPEAVLAYFVAREREFSNIRILMGGRFAKMRPDQIRERMRESYV